MLAEFGQHGGFSGQGEGGRGKRGQSVPWMEQPGEEEEAQIWLASQDKGANSPVETPAASQRLLDIAQASQPACSSAD